MLFPSIFGDSLMDDFMDDFDRSYAPAQRALYGKRAANIMKTDIHENDDAYVVDIDLPGFRKDEITLKLEDGYMTVEAAKAVDKDEEEKKTGKVIRQERFAGNCRRSFYVGDDVRPEDISASFENGVLTILVPKKTAPKEPERKTIEIL